MNLQIRNTVLAAMLLVASSGAFAAETADLVVSGTIRPSACNITLANGGAVDFGVISGVTLSNAAPTRLSTQRITMSVTCDAPTAVGYRVQDNRSGSASNAVRDASGQVISVHKQYGFGLVDGSTLGSYAIRALPADATADNAAVGGGTRSTDGGQTWLSAGGSSGGVNQLSYVEPGVLYAWSTRDGGAPGSYSTISQVLTIEGAVNSTTGLPSLTSAVPLDGQATISLVYL